jgi:hypothetical protein
MASIYPKKEHESRVDPFTAIYQIWKWNFDLKKKLAAEDSEGRGNRVGG